MAELSLDLFLAGMLTDKEYALLSFQPELHPDFDRTIGALTGERAKPDQPRDYVAIWRDRLEFERSRSRPDRDLIDQIQRILFVLCSLGTTRGDEDRCPLSCDSHHASNGHTGHCWRYSGLQLDSNQCIRGSGWRERQ